MHVWRQKGNYLILCTNSIQISVYILILKFNISRVCSMQRCEASREVGLTFDNVSDV